MNDRCWVGLEGQNFAASITDTQDLSTIRGGSLLLRNLVDAADRALTARFGDRVRNATQGGSFGIWSVEATEAELSAALPGLRAGLAAGAGRHLAFGIAAVADDATGYARQRLRLRAALQRARLAEPRVPYPNLDTVTDGVCPVDMVRPIARGKGQRIGADAELFTSESVHDRRRFGIDEKQKLLSKETLPERLSDRANQALNREGRPFAMQIGSISERRDTERRLKDNLQDKICVIALDGNGFGKIQDDALTGAGDTIETQRAFDQALRDLRRALISDVFGRVIGEGCEGPPISEEACIRTELTDPIGPDGPVIRFELLLWGGDEIMFIVPARVGWLVLEQIGASARDLTLNGQQVTFSVGAVFCHHDAPIARIKTLADNLCGHIKALKPDGDNGRDGKADTLFMAEVLESFDHVGMDLDAHLNRRTPKWPGDPFPAATKAAMRVLDLPELSALRRTAEALASGDGGNLSRGRLRQTAFALHRQAAPGAAYAGKDAWANFVRDSAATLNGDARRAALQVFKLPDGKKAEDTAAALAQVRLFALLEEYWDYLAPLRTEGAQT